MPSPSTDMTSYLESISALKNHINQQIFGQEELIEEALCCLFVSGHLLMTGAPGLAKTMLVKSIASGIGVEFGRIQFTPDLLPSDITGSDVVKVNATGGIEGFEFIKGPLFTSFLLADEINRASPRTQSALLEAMAERTCTVGGNHYKLNSPFMVFATQNPIENEGTFPLPEAQLDRFLLHSLVEYPDSATESRIFSVYSKNTKEQEASKATMDAKQLQAMSQVVDQVEVADELIDMVKTLIRISRPRTAEASQTSEQFIYYGAGPRGGLSLLRAAKSYALLSGETQLRWRHIKRMVYPALRHRIHLSTAAMAEGLNEDQVLSRLIEETESKHKAFES